MGLRIKERGADRLVVEHDPRGIKAILLLFLGVGIYTLGQTLLGRYDDYFGLLVSLALPLGLLFVLGKRTIIDCDRTALSLRKVGYLSTKETVIRLDEIDEIFRADLKGTQKGTRSVIARTSTGNTALVAGFANLDRDITSQLNEFVQGHKTSAP